MQFTHSTTTPLLRTRRTDHRGALGRTRIRRGTETVGTLPRCTTRGLTRTTTRGMTRRAGRALTATLTTQTTTVRVVPGDRPLEVA